MGNLHKILKPGNPSLYNDGTLGRLYEFSQSAKYKNPEAKHCIASFIVYF
jgi:hypothetical protein